MAIVKLRIYSEDGRVDRVDAPADFSLGDLLQEYLDGQNRNPLDRRGQPLLWRFEDRVTGAILSLEKTIEQNGIHDGQELNLVLGPQKHQTEHIEVGNTSDITLEVVAPDGRRHRAILPPDTLTHEFLIDLIESFGLSKADTWELFDEGRAKSLDSQKTLAENNVAAGQQLVIRRHGPASNDKDLSHKAERVIRCPRCQQETPAAVAFCNHCGAPLDRVPDLKLEVLAPDGKKHRAELPPDTSTQEFLADLIGKFELPKGNWELYDTSTGKALNSGQTLGMNGVVSGQQLLLRIRPVPPPGILDIVKKEWKKIAVVLVLIALAFRYFGKPNDSVSISIAPTGPIALSSSQTQAFSVSVKNGKMNTATWSLEPELGSVSPEGVYAAPVSVLSSQNVKVIARSQDDPTKTAAATILLVPTPIRVDPPKKTLGPNQSTQFTAEPATFSAEQAGELGLAVNWSLDPALGTITPDGVYIAPASIPTPQSVSVIATSKTAPENSARATISLTQSPIVQLAVTPRRVLLGASEKHQFTAALTPNSGATISWALNPPVGSISQQGLYVAPGSISATRKVDVAATLSTNPDIAAAATVILQPVSVSPISATASGSQITLHATVTHATNPNLVWSISPQVGNISSQGVYTPPASIVKSTDVTATATSQFDTTKSSKFIIHLTPKVMIRLNPYQSVMTSSQQQQLSATVTGSQNTSVTWTASGPGTISPNGLYVAPATIAPGGAVVQINVSSNADSTKHDTGSLKLTPGNGAPQRLKISQGVVQGYLLHRVSPVYPDTARSAGIQGTVVLQAIIGRDGAIHDLQVVSGPPTLTNSALVAVRQWRYRPYLLNGEAVEVETTITVNFTLED